MAARLTEQEREYRKLTERQWLKVVEDLARARGWRVFHPPDNQPVLRGQKLVVQRIGAGFPDLTLVRMGRLMFAELKREQGVVSDEQEQWLTELRHAGCEAYVWRPSQLTYVRALLQ